MKSLMLCLVLASVSFGAGIADVQSVYLLPMAGGLDQFLANRLVGVFRVVTDPKLADAVFTDRLGEPFEQKLAELYPKPDAEDVEKEDKATPPVSSFGRGRGTVFLVDADPKKYEERGRFDQPDRSKEQAWAHPVVANGRLYVRDQDVLLCYEVKAK